MRLLLIEDDRKAAKLLARGLREEGFVVDVAPTGEAGELWVRGHCVMEGYYHNPEATARAIDADGWLQTGDLARRREDGNYRIVGRLFNLESRDYKRFLNFLRKHDCQLPFKEFRQ